MGTGRTLNKSSFRKLVEQIEAFVNTVHKFKVLASTYRKDSEG